MIADHQKLDSELTNLVRTKTINVTIPNGVSDQQKSMLDKLRTLQGPDFDKEYRNDQYSGHRSAVSLFERYAKGGDNPDLKGWAQQAAPVLQHHLDMARVLDGQAMK